jgi:hypothetical protein
MNALAAAGVQFERAYAHAPITVPSHSSMFTSLPPTAHGVQTNFQRLSTSHLTLAELLHRSYRETAAFVSLGVLKTNAGLSQGFGEYHDEFEIDFWRTAEQMTDALIGWSARSTGAPFFLWAHYSDPHEPYGPPDPTGPTVQVAYNGRPVGTIQVNATTMSFPITVSPGVTSLVFQSADERLSEGLRIQDLQTLDGSITLDCESGCESIRDQAYLLQFPAEFTVRNDATGDIETALRLRGDRILDIPEARQRYLEEVEYADRHLGRLLDTLREAGQLDDTIVIFTADHGEGLGDHGGVNGMGHVNQLYQSQLRLVVL